MQALTPQAWSEHHLELRPYVLDRFPLVDRQELEMAGDRFEAVVELVRRSTSLDSDEVIRQLRTLYAPDLGFGTGDAHETGATFEEDDAAEEDGLAIGGPASLEKNLRFESGFTADDEPRVRELFQKLERRLQVLPADGTELVLMVKDRDTGTQRVTLDARIPRYGHYVATSQLPDLHDALMDVREDLLKQLGNAIDRKKEKKR